MGLNKKYVFALILLLCVSRTDAWQVKGGGFSQKDNAPEGWYDKSIALVVGISRYRNGWSSLDEPRNDAKRVAAALQTHGFQVIKLFDKEATKKNILTMIQTKIPTLVGKNSRFVFYFSGHGQTHIAARTGKKLGYLVPADGRRPAGMDDWASYISLETMRSQINNVIAAKHILVIFDSCFSGTALTKGGPLSGGVNYFLSQPAINVLTAGDAGQLVPDGVFAYDFVNAINGSADGVGGKRDGYVTFAEIGTYLQSQIPAKVSNLSPSFGWWDGTSQIVFRYAFAKADEPNVYFDMEKGKKNLTRQQAILEQQKAQLEVFLKKQQRIAEEQAIIAMKMESLKNEQAAVEQSSTGSEGGFSADGSRYRSSPCGSIIDTQTGLEWYVGPDRNMHWDDGRKWIANLRQCGGNWRLPTQKELKSIYINGAGKRNMDPLFRTTGWRVWSSASKDSYTAWYFYYYQGRVDWDAMQSSTDMRAFAVKGSARGG